MAGAPASNTDALGDASATLMPYDVVLLSCEGEETDSANPPALEAYLNAGGRAFASHFHYSWFSGPKETTQAYTAPADWGDNLATWTAGGGMDNGPIAGVIDATLNGSMSPFPKGVSLQKWRKNVGALGQNGQPAADLSIYSPRYNAVVAPANKPSQPWITSTHNGTDQTMYFSFDTPANATATTAIWVATVLRVRKPCLSDLHVRRATSVDSNLTPGNTKNGGQAPPIRWLREANVDLSPQEKALEFMLFDLSACVIPDTAAPPIGIPIQ